MAKFYNKGPAIFQEPVDKVASDGSRSVGMGFRVAICDNGCGDELADTYNAEVIVKNLNFDSDRLKELATWLLKQKSLFINKERREFLERIVS